MKNGAEFDCESFISPGTIHLFSRNMAEFSQFGRKTKNQLSGICGLFVKEGVIRRFVPWDEIDGAMNYKQHRDLAQLHSKLLNRVREFCIQACFEINPQTYKPFNQSGLVFLSRRGEGIEIGYISSLNGKSFTFAVRHELESLRSRLVRSAERGVAENELELVDQFLDFDPLGQAQLENYSIVRELGSGSTGVVYKAELKDSVKSRRGPAQSFALKLLHAHLSRDADFVKRLTDNAEKFRSMNHPNIARIVHVSRVASGYFYYVSEFVDGGTLDAWAEQRVLSFDEKIEVMGGIVDALAFLHGQDVVHGDLKPANVMVDRSGKPKLIDFDTSYFANMSTLSIAPLGPTLQYSSEELIIRPSERVADNDIFAFGIVALEFCNGCKGQSKRDHVRAIAEQKELRAIYPVLVKCLQPRNSIEGSLARYENGVALKEAWTRACHAGQDAAYPMPLIIGYHKQGVSLRKQEVRGRSFRREVLPQSDFTDATLIDCDFGNAVLSDATFIGTKLVNCNFEGAFLIMSRFHAVVLEKTHFRFTNLERSVWDDVDLEGVCFNGSNFWGTFLSRSRNLHMADLRFCNFCRTEMTSEQSAFVTSLEGISSGFRYADVRAAFQEFFPDFPESLWWLKMLTDTNESLILY